MKNKFEQSGKSEGVKREFVSEEYKNDLARLAEYIIHEDNLNTVEVLLDSGNSEDLQEARRLLLLAVDDCLQAGMLLDEEARRLYKVIGFTPDEASQIRQEQIGQ